MAEKCVIRFVPCNGLSVVLNCSLIQGAQFSHFESCALKHTESKESLQKCEMFPC